MATAGLLLAVFCLALVNVAYSTQNSALTLDLCDPLQESKQIVVTILAENSQRREQTITGDGRAKSFNIKVGEKLQQQATTDGYQFQLQQSIIKQVTLTSTASHICVKALVVDTIIVVDQPTDFKNPCPTSQDVLERPCKPLGDPIDVSQLFVCPERLKDLLLQHSVVEIRQGTGTTDGVPPKYDITSDMLQASSAIAEGITSGTGTVTEARQKYREAKNTHPLRKLGTFATTFETAASFIGALAPVFSVFSGIFSIATTFLTPNPFDEMAKYLDSEFHKIHNQLSNIQNDIADLGRLIEAKGGVLAMTEQLRAIRYAIRNYGNMVEALSTRPVCGATELKNMPKVEEFMRQYVQSDVDQALLDLYGVEFGELAEANSLIRPYMLAYCHGKKHLVEKFAQELAYYGYAGLQAHFTYRSLVAAIQGSQSQVKIGADDVWMNKLYKYLQIVNAFQLASSSNEALGLELDLEEDFMKKITENEAGIFDWLKQRITNPNDWPFQCFLKNSDGTVTNTLFIRYQKFSNINDLHVITTINFLRQKPWSYDWEVTASEQTYILAPSNEKTCLDMRRISLYYREFPDKYRSTDNVIFINYCPSPANCRNVKKRVTVAWAKRAVIFFDRNAPNGGRFSACSGSAGACVSLPATMLNSADRISREGQITPHSKGIGDGWNVILV